MTDTTTERPPLTDEERAGIRARLDAATPGPWRVVPVGSDTRRADVRTFPEFGYDYRGQAVATAADSEFGAVPLADADLIAHAPTDLAALLAERDDLAAENQRLRDTIQAVEALVVRWEREAKERGPFDEVNTAGVASLLRHAMKPLGVSGE